MLTHITDSENTNTLCDDNISFKGPDRHAYKFVFDVLNESNKATQAEVVG